MTTQASDGPIDVIGQQPPMTGPTPYVGGPAALVFSNPDLAPSLLWGGWGMRNPRYQARIGQGALAAGGYPNQDCGWYMSSGGLILTDEVPSTASTTNLAAGQHAANGTPMTLVSASGSGITVLAAAQTILDSGAIIPAGALAVDAQPGYVGGGTSGAFQFFDPTKGISRCLAVTAAAGATGGVIVLKGYDIYGQPMTQNVTAVGGSTVNTTKAFKFLVSATPQFADNSHNYSIGTADIFGFNILVPRWSYCFVYWNDALLTANTGFTAGVATTATATTGDVRGTYAVQSSSDGTKRLQIFAMPAVSNIVVGNFANALNGIFGVPQF